MALVCKNYRAAKHCGEMSFCNGMYTSKIFPFNILAYNGLWYIKYDEAISGSPGLTFVNLKSRIMHV